MTIVVDEHKKARDVNDRHHNDAKSSKCSLTETPAMRAFSAFQAGSAPKMRESNPEYNPAMSVRY